MRDRHGTPFEHNSFRFHIRCPIFVAREWMRHRVGSFNEFSMRYAKATDDFYVPDADDVRTQVGKPGAYSFDPVGDEVAETTREELQAVYEAAFRRAGLLRVRDLAEFFDAAETLGRVRAVPGKRLAILTNGGGIGVLAVDRLIDLGESGVRAITAEQKKSLGSGWPF